MLEYLVLAEIENSMCIVDKFDLNNGIKYNMKKVRERLDILRQEILEPYAIVKNSRE